MLFRLVEFVGPVAVQTIVISALLEALHWYFSLKEN